jgi:hypothetical protein
MKKTLLFTAIASMLTLTTMAQTSGKVAVAKKAEVKHETQHTEKAKAEVKEVKTAEKAKVAAVEVGKPTKKAKKG